MEPPYLACDYYQGARVAEGYDRARFRSPLGRIRAALDRWTLRRCLSDVPAESPVLDIACGTGRITQFLAEQGFKVTGTDVSRAMLEVARRRMQHTARSADLFVADAERLPLPESAVRAATAIRLMGNLPREVRIACCVPPARWRTWSLSTTHCERASAICGGGCSRHIAADRRTITGRS